MGWTWSKIKNRFEHQKNLGELEKILKQEWEQISHEKYLKLVDSMPQRVENVLPTTVGQLDIKIVKIKIYLLKSVIKFINLMTTFVFNFIIIITLQSINTMHISEN